MYNYNMQTLMCMHHNIMLLPQTNPNTVINKQIKYLK